MVDLGAQRTSLNFLRGIEWHMLCPTLYTRHAVYMSISNLSMYPFLNFRTDYLLDEY